MPIAYQYKLTSLFCFNEDIFSFCTTPVEILVNDGTPQNVDAVSSYMRVGLCDSDKR